MLVCVFIENCRKDKNEGRAKQENICMCARGKLVNAKLTVAEVKIEISSATAKNLQWI